MESIRKIIKDFFTKEIIISYSRGDLKNKNTYKTQKQRNNWQIKGITKTFIPVFGCRKNFFERKERNKPDNYSRPILRKSWGRNHGNYT